MNYLTQHTHLNQCLGVNNMLFNKLMLFFIILFVIVVSGCASKSGRGCYNYDEFNRRYVHCSRFHNGQ